MQKFFAEVLAIPSGTLVANFSNNQADFWLDGLLPSTEYQIRVWAANDHGRSSAMTLLSPVMPHVGKLTESGKCLGYILEVIVVNFSSRSSDEIPFASA